MAGAHGNPDDLKRFAGQLRAAHGQVTALGRDLRRTLGSLDWNDQVKQKIDADVSAVIAGLDRFSGKLEEHAKEVDRKAAELRQYLGR